MRSRYRFCATLLLGLSLAGAAQAGEFEATPAEVDAWVVADVDENGALTEDEFPRFVDAMADTGQSTARTIRFFGAYGIAFSVADRNGDGRLSPEELRSADDGYREDAER